MQPSENWKGLSVPFHGLNVRTGASAVTDSDFTDYPAFTELNNGQEMGENTNMFWLYDTEVFPLNNLIDDWSICYTAVNNNELSLSNIGVFTMDIDNPTYTTDNNDHNGIMFYNSNGYMRIANNVPPQYGTPQLNDRYRFYCPPYNNSRYVWTPNATGTRSSQGYLNFYGGCNVQGYAAPYKSFGIKSLFLEIRVYPTNTGGQALPLSDYSLKEYMLLSTELRENNPIAYAYARVHRRGNTDGTYTADGNGYDINAAITVPFHGNSYSNIGAYFNNVYYRVGVNLLFLPLFGNASSERDILRYNKQDNTADIFYGYDRIDYRNIRTDTSSEREYTFAMSGSEENAEYLRKSCAAYGLFFCDDINTSDNKNLASSALEANNGRWLHNDMYLGIIEENGYTEGRYTRGIENGLQSQFNWTDSTESTYNPDVPPVPENHYSSSTTFNSIGNLATLTRRYALSGGAVTNLGKNLWKISDDIAVADPMDPYAKYDAQILNTFLTSNPIDCIISLRRYPLTLPYGSSTTIKLGKVDTLVSCYEMDEPCHTYEFRGIPIMPNFGNSFLDYAPYTEFELYVPFCGTTKLNPADILGRTLNVKLVVDFDTGTCTGYIMSNNLVIETINGSIAIDIPVTGTDSTTVQAQLSHGIITAESAKTQERMTYGKTLWPTGIVSAALNPFGTANTFAQNEANVNKAQYDVEHTVAPSHVIGSASPVSKWAIDLNCRLIIYYPTGKCIELVNGVPQFESNELNMFGAHVGFATLDEVSHYDTYTGLVVGANPKLGQMQTQNGTRYATADELNMIRQAIEQGIII